MADLNVDGLGRVREAVDNLRDRYAENVTYVAGTNVEYAVYLEFGRGPVEAQSADALQFQNEAGDTIYRARVSGHPPYPFFRPAIREFKAAPEALIVDETGYPSVDEIPSTKALVEAAATALTNRMKNNANAQKSVDRSPGTHPDHPVRDSGNLTASIQAVRVQ